MLLIYAGFILKRSGIDNPEEKADRYLEYKMNMSTFPTDEYREHLSLKISI